MRADIITDPSRDKTVVNGVTMTDVLNQLEQQISSSLSMGHSPAQTNHLGYYCGKSAAQNDIIMYNPIGYVKFITDLFSDGSAKFGDKGLTVKVPKSLTGGLTGQNGVGAVDEVFGKSLDYSTSNKSFIRGIINFVSNKLSDEGNTIPFEYNRILKAVGMKSMTSSSYGNYKIQNIKKMQGAIANGYIPIVFDNGLISSGSTGNKDREKYGIHYISIHSLEIKGNNVEFTYWDYGEISQPQTRTIEQFTEGMKGYWIPKNEYEK